MIKNLSKTFKYINANGQSVLFVYDDGFLINKPEGIDTVLVSLSEAQGINQVGTTVQSVNVQSRPVTVSGRLVGEYQDRAKELLMSVIRPDISGRLYCDDYYLNVWVTATPTIEPKTSFAFFQFQLLAPYPYWQKDESANINLAGVAPLFKFPWNISRSYAFGVAQKTQFVSVINSGQVPVPFRITFKAKNTVENPKLENVSSGQFLKLKKTMMSGEQVVVDITHERTYVTSSVDGNIRGTLSLDSSFDRLLVGENVLKPSAEQGTDQLEVDIDFAVEIIGVTA